MWKLGLAAVALTVASPALADEWDFILTNNTGKTIKTVEVAPTGTNQWQPNRIDPEFAKADATVKPGARMTVHFDKDSACRYDLKIGFTDGSTSTWTGVNICDNSYVSVKYNAAGATTFTVN